MAVGAYHESSNAVRLGGDESNNDVTQSGAAYLFTRSGTSWTQHNYIKATNPGSIDLFGYSLALTPDGNTLAVSAYQESSDSTGVGGSQVNSGARGSSTAIVLLKDLATMSLSKRVLTKCVLITRLRLEAYSGLALLNRN